MKKSNFKIDYFIIIPVLLMAIISILTINSATKLLGSFYSNLQFKQLFWYILGFIIVIIIMKYKNKFITDNIWYIYGLGILSLILLLIFGNPINNAKCWFVIPGIGTLQPSEFMKIILIITLSVVINDFNTKYSNPTIKEEFMFLVKVAIIVLIPSILTFLQPDTGVVLIYLLITFVMLFISGIRYWWFLLIFSILLLVVGIVLMVYFTNKDTFVNIFGTSFFLRVDRLLDWSSKSGYQLLNGMSAIGSAGLFGNGYLNTPIYFPEPQTDFIFAVYASNFGYIGSVVLLGIICFFDYKLVELANKTKSKTNKYILAGIIGMLLYQQLQNISMTFGLMPITGITLPFISYGGSSLLSYMIILGVILNISNEVVKYKK